VIAGRNFGLGSSRPVAALMRQLGVAALVAEESNSLFLRNAFNNGLPAVTVPDVRDYVSECQTITVDLEDSVLIADEARLEFAPLPDFVLQILDAGGLLPRLVADGFMPAEAAGVRA
jgi:3-isopropylmalate/(R)-2-methylmalate dehydratase small subunit